MCVCVSVHASVCVCDVTHIVIRIEHTGDILSQVAIEHGLDVVTMVDCSAREDTYTLHSNHTSKVTTMTLSENYHFKHRRVQFKADSMGQRTRFRQVCMDIHTFIHLPLVQYRPCVTFYGCFDKRKHSQ